VDIIDGKQVSPVLPLVAEQTCADGISVRWFNRSGSSRKPSSPGGSSFSAIIQDDTADLATEIGRVAIIFGGACVTISAASTASCTEGFLEQRVTDDLHQGLPTILTCQCPADGVRVINVTQERSIAHRPRNPIDSRA
jgi:hypothetical protein